MVRQPRSPSAIMVSALVFGSIASPYVYLAPGLGDRYTVDVLTLAGPLLIACATLLMLVLTRQSDGERWLRRRLGKTFAPLFYSLSVGAFLLNGAMLAALADFGLLTAVEYWYYLAIILGLSVAGALLVIVVTPPSRLESAVARTVTATAPTRVYWRVLWHGVLLVLPLLCAWALYRKHARDVAAREDIGWQARPDRHAVVGRSRTR
jgi:hypothetical protein